MRYLDPPAFTQTEIRSGDCAQRNAGSEFSGWGASA
jgi:hypothetical protein